MAIHLALAVLVTAAAALLLDRLPLALEARGWMDYRGRKPRIRNLGSAMLELHSQLEPHKRHVLEPKREERAEEDDEVGPDDPSRPRQARP